MPIYEYICRACSHEFEQLIRKGDTPTCPACQGQDLERQLSNVAVSSESTREANLAKGRKAREHIHKGHDEAQRDAIRHHIKEHSSS